MPAIDLLCIDERRPFRRIADPRDAIAVDQQRGLLAQSVAGIALQGSQGCVLEQGLRHLKPLCSILV